MALTTASINSATPATDLYNAWATLFTAAGWTNLSDISAATAGTTAANKVWVTAATTVASSVYTGCIVFIEVDDTNNRLRIRCAEKYDSSSAGAPATGTVKWAVLGCNAASNKTPTANYALDDTFLTLFQSTGTTQKVGWIEVTTVTSGAFQYWMGVNASRFVIATHAGGIPYVCHGGVLSYQGDINTGTTNVFLMAGLTTSNAVTNGSWGVSAATATPTCNVRTSREPGALQAARLTWWCFDVDGPSGSNNQANQSRFGRPGQGNSLYYAEPYIVFPAWLHGGSYPTDSVNGVARANFATLPEAVVFLPGGDNTLTRTIGPPLGEVVTISGTSYTSLGVIAVPATTTNSAYLQGTPHILIDGSQF